ncbi:collagen alpha-1(III) chain-like [Notechis scutatus]|uniref:Collagen alpha-1(III) chain-like n=1 Tax=Notechis scutatus TaxID=8663 RepID=A0A6J1V827_9SAUR|nr:collagen alpha-1(III) chain-like [Notechis scutatus]
MPPPPQGGVPHGRPLHPGAPEGPGRNETRAAAPGRALPARPSRRRSVRLRVRRGRPPSRGVSGRAAVRGGWAALRLRSAGGHGGPRLARPQRPGRPAHPAPLCVSGHGRLPGGPRLPPLARPGRCCSPRGRWEAAPELPGGATLILTRRRRRLPGVAPRPGRSQRARPPNERAAAAGGGGGRRRTRRALLPGDTGGFCAERGRAGRRGGGDNAKGRREDPPGPPDCPVLSGAARQTKAKEAPRGPPRPPPPARPAGASPRPPPSR